MAATLMRPASISNSGTNMSNPGGKRYRIERTLGEGTYGKVKLAYDNYTREKVAIKIIRKENVKTKKDMERVRREIDILSVLRHPHIIKVIDVVETRTNIIIVMEYAVNGELFDYINERRYLDESESRKYFRQIVSAVDYCHKNLIVHRDLKLENLLLDKDMNIKIIDFGLSNQYAHDCLLNTFCGSPLYASPEMIQGKEYKGPEVDCWSLGVVLYTLLCGTMPFDDSDMKHLVESITTASYPHPKGLTKSALDMIARLLRANPKKRATIENIRLHPWTNDGYSKPPMQQPLSNINHKDRRRLSSKISCLVETPIKGMTPGSRTRSDSRLNERSMKPRTPSASMRPSTKSGETPVSNPNAKRRLVMEPSSPQPAMKSVSEEPEIERPKSASAMLSKVPSKPPRPSRSKIERCEMMGIPGSPTKNSDQRSGSESEGRQALSPDSALKRSSSHGNKVKQSSPESKFKLTPDRRTLSENTSLAQFSSDYERDINSFKPPAIKDAGEITMIDSESHLFDGFGGSTRNVYLDPNITDITKELKEPSIVISPTEPPKPDNKTPVPEENSTASKKTPTPTNPPSTQPEKTTKKSLSARTSLPKREANGPSARSKAAINKTGLGAKRPLGRPSESSTQRGKSATTNRDRPSSVKSRTPVKSHNTISNPSRSRRNSDVITGSLSNLSIRSETDKSTSSETGRTRITRNISTAPSSSPAKRNLNVKSKVDCHRTPKRSTTASSGSGEIIKKNDKDKEGVKSKISALITNRSSKTSNNKKPTETSLGSAPNTPRSKRANKVTVS
ncbi:hypothetical protein ACHWQZ_G011833 [Mnemiopsis leidyi]